MKFDLSTVTHTKYFHPGLILGGVLGSYFLFRWFFINGRHVSMKHDLKGKNIIITGASDGIGLMTAKLLAKMGATLILAVRDEKKVISVIKDIVKETGNKNISYLLVDLSDLDSVTKFAKDFHKLNIPLDILINNAGATFRTFSKSPQGYEKMFATNYLGHFLLNHLLMDDLVKTKGRLIIVASEAHNFVKDEPQDFDFKTKAVEWNDFGLMGILRQYGYTKLLNVLHGRAMHNLFNSKGVQVNSLHPGAIFTALSREGNTFEKMIMDPLMYLFFKTPYQGSKCTIHVVVKKDNVSGEYYDDSKVGVMSKIAKDDKVVKDVYEWTLDQVKSYLPQ